MASEPSGAGWAKRFPGTAALIEIGVSVSLAVVGAVLTAVFAASLFSPAPGARSSA